MADNAEAPAVFGKESHVLSKKANHNIIIGVDTRLDDAHLSDMVKAAKEKYSAGDVVHVIHVVGEHEGHIRGHSNAVAQEQEEKEAREFIAKKVEPLLKEQNMAYEVEIKYGSWDVETIGAIIAKRAEDLDASIVVLASTHRNFIEKIFVGSVSKWVAKHTHAPVKVVE